MSEFRINYPDNRQEKWVTWSANDAPIQISGAVRRHHGWRRGHNSQSTHQRNTNQRHNQPRMVLHALTNGRRDGKILGPTGDKVVRHFHCKIVVATIASTAWPCAQEWQNWATRAI